MIRRVLDSNKLFSIWFGARLTPKLRNHPRRPILAAESWLKKNPADGILSPVRLEFLGGTRNKTELKLATEFLDMFPNFDVRKVSQADWREAERLARRIPHDGRSRGAIDCLLQAICNRLHSELVTDDTGARAFRGF